MAATVVRPGQLMVVAGITYARDGMRMDPGDLVGVFDAMEQALDFIEGGRLAGNVSGYIEVLVAGSDAVPRGAIVLDQR